MILKIKTESIFTDITDKIIPTIDNGFCVIYSMHTTCGVAILENESLLKKDMEAFFERIAPKKGVYAHDDIAKRDVPPDERINGFSHIRSMLFPTSVVIPVKDGKLIMGTWQKLFLLEFDPRRERELFIGEIETNE